MGEAIMEEDGKRKYQKGPPGKKQNYKSTNKGFSQKNQEKPEQSRANPTARLIIRNISFKTTEEALRKHFESYGDIYNVKVLKRPDGKLVGCAFVQFKNIEMANEAILKTNRQLFLGRPISVDFAVAKNEYIQHLDQKKLELKESGNVKLDSADEDGDSKRPVYLDGKPTMEDDSKPKNQKGLRGKNRNDKKGNETQKRTKKPDQPRANPNARLIIRNISFKTTEETLRKHFESYGDIHDVKVLKKPDGKLVGCAFVQFKNIPMANEAILKTNMQPFLGRPISVDFAVPKNKYMQHLDQQQLELKESVKVESESEDEDDDSKPVDLDGELKEEIKSESENSEDESGSDESEDEDQESDEDEDEEQNDESDQEQDDNDSQFNDKRVQLNDAEDGCTVFVRNVPFSSTETALRALAERSGPVRYALLCVDPLTEHPRGTAFVKFQNAADAGKFLALDESELRLDGQAVLPTPALRRDHLGKGNRKEPKDARNLYLVKEGVVVAGSRAAVGVSASDMSKRLALEQSKTQMLKNLNRFVSKYRLVVSNLPVHLEDAEFRRICVSAAPRDAVLTEARVMRDLRAPTYPNGKHQSKGYGFAMFMRHEDALACLRKLNNNPDIFNANNRPIVSFSIEDRAALNARKKRLEKSVFKNPLSKKFQGNVNDSKTHMNKRPINSKQDPNNKNGPNNKQNHGLKRKNESENLPSHPKEKKTKFNKKKEKNISDKKPVGVSVSESVGDFAGITAKEGAPQKMRSRFKLREQADIHREQLKKEKKTSKNKLKLKRAVTERIKLPKMKTNKKKLKQSKEVQNKSTTKRAATENPKQFSDLVNKYKSKLISGNSLDRVKSKWYE